MEDTMKQVAPRPVELYDLVDNLVYRPGWTFSLQDLDRGQGSEGLTLIVTSLGYDSYHPERGEVYRVNHFMPVPPAAYDRRSWQHWLLDQLLLIERHETCEFFRLRSEDGAEPYRPYAPSHGPGNDPYIVREIGTVADQETSFRGERKRTVTLERLDELLDEKNYDGADPDTLHTINDLREELGLASWIHAPVATPTDD